MITYDQAAGRLLYLAAELQRTGCVCDPVAAGIVEGVIDELTILAGRLHDEQLRRDAPWVLAANLRTPVTLADLASMPKLRILPP